MTFTAMARLPTLSDEEIAARTRAVFVECGFGGRTKQIAAAVGLTWGAIALRFGSKRTLFTRVMAEPVHPSGHADCERKDWADLPSLLEWLSDNLWGCWPLRLQVRLAATAANPCEERVAPEQKQLAEVLEGHARRGSVRSDISPRALAQMVLALVTGDVAQRFVERERTLTKSPASIATMVRLLSRT
jgi:AcrR family transcriptional regulator